MNEGEAKFSRGVMYAPDLKITGNRKSFQYVDWSTESPDSMHELISTCVFSLLLLFTVSVRLSSISFLHISLRLRIHFLTFQSRLAMMILYSLHQISNRQSSLQIPTQFNLSTRKYLVFRKDHVIHQIWLGVITSSHYFYYLHLS